MKTRTGGTKIYEYIETFNIFAEDSLTNNVDKCASNNIADNSRKERITRANFKHISELFLKHVSIFTLLTNLL